VKISAGSTTDQLVDMDIWPEIDVQDYEGLEVTRKVHRITDEEIDRQLEDLRERHAVERSVERPLEKGDVLVADLQRLDDADLLVIGERFEQRRFVLSEEGGASPEFEEALLGITVGEERNIRFSYREDLPDEQLAGTTDHFLVTAREIHERVLPDLDDEFAKDLGDQYASLEDLKADLRARAERQWSYVTREQFRGDLIDRLLVANPFEMPESMVLSYVRTMRRERRRDEASAEAEADEEDEDIEPTEEERQYAERQLRRYLLMEGLRKKLDVQVSDEELEASLAQRAEAYGAPVESLRRSGRADELRRELEEDKVFDLLASKAKITEETI